MGKNKKAREELERLYGKECFIEKLRLRDTRGLKYTGKGQLNKMKQLTYHHIKMKKDGGKATVENGALLSAENHAWFHKQTPQAQGYMNAMFQEYKRQADECRVVFVDDLKLPFEVKTMDFSVDENGKINKTKENKETTKQRRAREKRELKEMIEELDYE